MGNPETQATLGNEQSRDTGNIGDKTQNKDKQKHTHTHSTDPLNDPGGLEG